MDDHQIQLGVQRKRKRDEEEMCEDEEMEIVMLVISFIGAIIGAWCHPRYIDKQPSLFGVDEKYYRRELWIRALRHESTCIEQLRMTTHAFDKLCRLLCDKGGLVATQNVTIREVVALFLHVLAHNLKNSTLKAMLGCSGETVSRQFYLVLRAVIKVGRDLIKPHDRILDERDEKWKWFQNTLGALDGTFIPVTVPLEDKLRYRSRKSVISTNVLGVCDHNMKFTYVLPGWEGSASDSRVLRDALRRRNGLKLPLDKYYLVDAGYMNGPGFLAPYRGTRYHLKEWRVNTPTNYKELFNLRHSSARNTIERAFGLMKKRWAILRTPSFYDVETQIRIINACFALHNFIRGEMLEEELLNAVDRDLEDAPLEDDDQELITTVTVTEEWTNFRDNLAMEMFEDYQARRARA